MRLGCWVFEAGPGVLWLDFGVLSGGHGFQAVAWGSGCGQGFQAVAWRLEAVVWVWGCCWGVGGFAGVLRLFQEIWLYIDYQFRGVKCALPGVATRTKG